MAAGTYSLSDGSLSTLNEEVGYSSTGNFTQSGGTNTISHSLYLGRNSGSTGTYSLSGSGQLSALNEYVGYSGTGNFTQSGGTNTFLSGRPVLGYASGTSGTYNLNGGILILPALSGGSGTAAFNFGGGTLQASGSFTSTLPMTLTGSGGNATVDTAGYAVTLSGSLSGTGGLSKTDSGILVLSGTNKYTGGTTVTAGTLDFASPAASPTAGILTVKAGGYVALGALLGASSPATEKGDAADATENVASSSENVASSIPSETMLPANTIEAAKTATLGGAAAWSAGSAAGGVVRLRCRSPDVGLFRRPRPLLGPRRGRGTDREFRPHDAVAGLFSNPQSPIPSHSFRRRFRPLGRAADRHVLAPAAGQPWQSPDDTTPP